jgi:hypothetical protein
MAGNGGIVPSGNAKSPTAAVACTIDDGRCGDARTVNVGRCGRGLEAAGIDR